MIGEFAGPPLIDETDALIRLYRGIAYGELIRDGCYPIHSLYSKIPTPQCESNVDPNCP